MQAARFWFHTIALSVTAAVLFGVAIAIATGSAVWAFGQKDPSARGDSRTLQTLTGVLTDVHCGARHPSDSGLSAGDCARICIKQGSSWALIDGEKVYALKGDSPYLTKLSGERVRVSGSVQGNIVEVQSVEAAVP